MRDTSNIATFGFFEEELRRIASQLPIAMPKERAGLLRGLSAIEVQINARYAVPSTNIKDLDTLRNKTQFLRFNFSEQEGLDDYLKKRGALFTKYFFHDYIYYRKKNKSYKEDTGYRRIKNANKIIQQLAACETHEDYYQLIVTLAAIIGNTKKNNSSLKLLLLKKQESVLQLLQNTHCDPALLAKASALANHTFRQQLANNLEEYRQLRSSIRAGSSFIKDQFSVLERNELFLKIDWLHSILAKIDRRNENQDSAAIYLEYLQACAFVLGEIGDPTHKLSKKITENLQSVAGRFKDHYPAFSAAQLKQTQEVLALVNEMQTRSEKPGEATVPGDIAALTDDYQTYKNARAAQEKQLKQEKYKALLAEAIIKALLAEKALQSGDIAKNADLLGSVFNLLGVSSASMLRNPDALVQGAGAVIAPIAVAGQLGNSQMRADEGAEVSLRVSLDDLSQFAHSVSERVYEQFKEKIDTLYCNPNPGVSSDGITAAANFAAKYVQTYLRDDRKIKPAGWEALAKEAADAVGSYRIYDSIVPMKQTTTSLQDEKYHNLVLNTGAGITLQNFYESGRVADAEKPADKTGPVADANKHFNNRLIRALAAYRQKRADWFNQYFLFDTFKFRGNAPEEFTKHQRIKNTDALIEKIRQCKTAADYLSLLDKISGLYNQTQDPRSRFKNLLLDLENQILQQMQETAANDPLLDDMARVVNHDLRKHLQGNLAYYQNWRMSIASVGDFLHDKIISTKERNKLFSYIDWLNSILDKVPAKEENLQDPSVYLEYYAACNFVLQHINDPEHELSHRVLDNQRAVLKHFQLKLAETSALEPGMAASYVRFNDKLQEANDKQKRVEFEKLLTEKITNKILAHIILLSKEVSIESKSLTGFGLKLTSIFLSGLATPVVDPLTSIAAGLANVPVGLSQDLYQEYLYSQHIDAGQGVAYENITKFAVKTAADLTAQVEQGLYAVYQDPYKGGDQNIKELAEAGAERVLKFLQTGVEVGDSLETLTEEAVKFTRNHQSHSIIPLRESTLYLQDGKSSTIQAFYERTPQFKPQDWNQTAGTRGEEPGIFGYQVIPDEQQKIRPALRRVPGLFSEGSLDTGSTPKAPTNNATQAQAQVTLKNLKRQLMQLQAKQSSRFTALFASKKQPLIALDTPEQCEAYLKQHVVADIQSRVRYEQLNLLAQIVATLPDASALRDTVQKQQFECFNAIQQEGLRHYYNNRNATLNKNILTDINNPHKSDQEHTRYQRTKTAKELREKLLACKCHEDYANFIYAVSDGIDSIQDHRSTLKRLLRKLQKQTLLHLQNTGCGPQLLRAATKIANHNFRQNLIGDLANYQAKRQKMTGGLGYFKDKLQYKSLLTRNKLFGYVDWLKQELNQINYQNETSDGYLRYVNACVFVLQQINDPKHELSKIVAAGLEKTLARFLDHHPKYNAEDLCSACGALNVALPYLPKSSHGLQARLQQALDKAGGLYNAGSTTHQQSFLSPAEESFNTFKAQQDALNEQTKMELYEGLVTQLLISRILNSKVISSGKIPIKPNGLGTAFNLLSLMGSYAALSADIAVYAVGKAANLAGTAGSIGIEASRLKNHATVDQTISYDNMLPFAKAVAAELTSQYKDGITKIHYDAYASGDKWVKCAAENAVKRMINYLENGANAKPHDANELTMAVVNAVSERSYDRYLPLESALLKQNGEESTLQALYERSTRVHPGMQQGEGFVGKNNVAKKPGEFGFRVLSTAKAYYESKSPTHSYFFNAEPVDQVAEGKQRASRAAIHLGEQATFKPF